MSVVNILRIDGAMDCAKPTLGILCGRCISGRSFDLVLTTASAAVFRHGGVDLSLKRAVGTEKVN